MLWSTLVTSAILGSTVCNWCILRGAFSDLGVPSCPVNTVFNTGLVLSALLLAVSSAVSRDKLLAVISALLALTGVFDETSPLHTPIAAALITLSLYYTTRVDAPAAILAASTWALTASGAIGAAIPEAAAAAAFTIACVKRCMEG